MKKFCMLITVILLSAFFSFFNPDTMEISFSVFKMINCIAIAFAGVFCIFKHTKIKSVKLSKIELCFSLLLGFCLMLGFGLLHRTGFGVFYGSIVSAAFSVLAWAFYSFLSVEIFKFTFLITENLDAGTVTGKFFLKNRLSKGVLGRIENNSFSFYFLFLILAWLIPYIINFPGWVMFDTRNQLKMYYHMPNHHTDASVLLDPAQYITQHHSVPHTLWVGFILDFGKDVFGTYDAGVFIYCVSQYVVMALIMACLLKSVRPYFGVKYVLITLLVFAFYPFYPTSAFLMTKDIYFCGLFILYMIKYCELIRNSAKIKEKKFFIQFLLITLGLILLRNNALYSLIIISCGLFFFAKQKKLIALYTVIMLVFNMCYTSILLPALKISPGSVREMLSIPFQQTANYVNKHGEEVTAEEKAAISKILDYEVIQNEYNPELSDAVKDSYNKYATGEDLKNYFIVWGQMLFKHPVTYVEAFIHQNYGYYCPGVKDSLSYDCLNDFYARRAMRNKDGIDFPGEKPGVIRTWYYSFQSFMYSAPFLNLIMDTGAYIWLWIIMMLVIVRESINKKYLMYYLPYFAYLIFILVGPANGTIYSRYIMPFVYTLPIMFLPLFEGKIKAE